MKRQIGILAHGGVSPDPGDALRGLVKANCGLTHRRTGRFIDLALAGACACINGAEPKPALPADCAVFLATGQCHESDTIELLGQTVRDRQPPTPFTFINASANTAGYYIAQTFGLDGENVTVSRRGGPFEAALQLAAVGLQLGRFPRALVGGVDELNTPVDDYRRRRGLAPDTPVAEGSHWVLLGDAPGTGCITDLLFTYDLEEALRLGAVRDGDRIWAGNGVVPAALVSLGFAETDIAAGSPGSYESSTARWLCERLNDRSPTGSVHLTRSPDGGWSLLRMEAAAA